MVQGFHTRSTIRADGFSSAQLHNFANDLTPFTLRGFSAIVRAC